ncbi:MAG: EAL domain-containing protein [Actinomycetota bacterium]
MTRGERRRLGRVPIVAVLGALAALPLLGAMWFAVDAVGSTRAAQTEVRRIDAEVAVVVDLDELVFRLNLEKDARVALDGLRAQGIDPGLVAALTGIDVPEEYDVGRARVDELVAAHDLTDLAAVLAEVRATDGADQVELNDVYREIRTELADDVADRLRALFVDAGSTDRGGDLVVAMRDLERASWARMATTEMVQSVYGVLFNPGESDARVEALVADVAVRAERLEDLAEVADHNEDAVVLIRELRTAPELDLGPEVERIRADSGLVIDPDELELEDLQRIARIGTIAHDLGEMHDLLVELSRQDVSSASADLIASARGDVERTTWAAGALVVASLVVVVGAASAIARPAKRLGAAAQAIRDGAPGEVAIGDGGPRELARAGGALDEAAHSLVLVERQARALAAGNLDHPDLAEPAPGAIGASLQAAVDTLATSLRDREAFRRRVTHEATHDGLTGLPNRTACVSQLQQALARTRRADRELAVLVVDIDGFKAVNDQHGHQLGDRTLRTIAERLAAVVRDGDHIGRLGGNEFLITAEPIDDVDDAVALAERVRSAISAEMAVAEPPLRLTATVGIGLCADHDLEAEELLHDADLAVFTTKQHGGDGVAICDADLRERLDRQADLDRAIRVAIAEDELELHYQPIVDAASGRVAALEALIRWERPGHGRVSPGDFIPFAERSDLIISLDRWVLDAAARQRRAWDDEGALVGVPVSVNVSGRHLAHPDFVEDVLSASRRHGVRLEDLIVEVTETAVLDDPVDAASRLQQLRAAGAAIAIDDFGTGYTSIGHLRHLPVDVLKIDRSFVEDDDAASLVRLIIEVAHVLGATTTAEGVETSDQADRLTGQGADKLQGFLFSRPVPAGEVAAALATVATG